MESGKERYVGGESSEMVVCLVLLTDSFVKVIDSDFAQSVCTSKEDHQPHIHDCRVVSPNISL
jgi:hypothetical protein